MDLGLGHEAVALDMGSGDDLLGLAPAGLDDVVALVQQRLGALDLGRDEVAHLVEHRQHLPRLTMHDADIGIARADSTWVTTSSSLSLSSTVRVSPAG